MPFVDLAGGRFHYAEVGSGRPFVFAHGLGGDASQPLGFCTDLDGWRAVAIDFRGHGRTVAGLESAQLSFDGFAGDLAAVLDRLRLDRVVLGGISMGAGVALALALAQPARVTGLALVRPAWLDASFPANLRAFPLVARLLEEHGEDEGERRFRQSPEFAELAAGSTAAATSLLAQFHRPQARARCAVLAAMPGSVPVRPLARCGELRVPTLVVVNGQDPVHPEALGEQLAAAIPGARLGRITPKAVAESRHASDLEGVLREFLGALGPL